MLPWPHNSPVIERLCAVPNMTRVLTAISRAPHINISMTVTRVTIELIELRFHLLSSNVPMTRLSCHNLGVLSNNRHPSV